jgi:hypothetical protein
MMPLKLGSVIDAQGSVTSLVMVRPGREGDMETALGFADGALTKGYDILLLHHVFCCEDLLLNGTPYFTGRRLGRVLPSGSTATLRMHMYDHVLKAHGLDGAEAFRDLTRKGGATGGRRRLVKIVPHGGDPALMAGRESRAQARRVPTLDLRRSRHFLVAARVTPDGIVQTPRFQADVRAQTGARGQLRRYLEAA